MPKTDPLKEPVDTGAEEKVTGDANIPVTNTNVTCIFVSDGVYKYVDADGKDVI